ncbi:hypothetical protein AADZ90_006195 [Aestuariibius sp. 2305UL40-4]|uniref:hypothetical protein n=1 Tax=Aestuariibius violaceus TaxID=3234132 RepID=UPI00345EEE2D
MRTSKADAALGRGGQAPSRFGGAEWMAVGLSGLWLVLVVILFLVDPGSAPRRAVPDLLLVLVVVLTPIGLIWVSAVAIRSSRVVQAESERLQAAIDAMRKTYVAERQAGGGMIRTRPDADEMVHPAAAGRGLKAVPSSNVAVMQPKAEAPAPEPAPEVEAEAEPESQPSLSLGPQAIALTLDRPDLIRALNFPDTPEDQDGFAALRRALTERSTAQLIQASQDVLTLLSQDGIYMDDLDPDPARPSLWRRFAQGERGPEMGAVGGIRDRSAIALAAGRMRADTIFRDAAHHFLRKFDQMLIAFEEGATDQEMLAMAGTRSARAFMLIGRAAGTFD